jgi:hypothetical protein
MGLLVALVLALVAAEAGRARVVARLISAANSHRTPRDELVDIHRTSICIPLH